MVVLVVLLLVDRTQLTLTQAIIVGRLNVVTSVRSSDASCFSSDATSPVRSSLEICGRVIRDANHG
jgi:hypothetical protein